jgi:hypothetical protein
MTQAWLLHVYKNSPLSAYFHSLSFTFFKKIMIQQPPTFNFIITRPHNKPANTCTRKGLPSILIGNSDS